MYAMSASESNTRLDLMRLVPQVVVEGARIVETFAHSQNMHQTDVEALSLLMVADTQGSPPFTMGSLGAELNLTSGATTFAVARLERAGLVLRARDEANKRQVLLDLSDAGRALAHRFFNPVHRISQSVMDQFSPEELDVVSKFLKATAEAMTSHRRTMEKN